MEATIETLESKKLPVRFFEIDVLNEECVGFLMMCTFLLKQFCAAI